VPTREESVFAQRALAAAGRDLLYARVDVVSLPNGGLALMELEAIEPYLFLASEDQARPYAAAIAAALG
jgi:hypothetical protein